MSKENKKTEIDFESLGLSDAVLELVKQYDSLGNIIRLIDKEALLKYYFEVIDKQQ